MSFITYLQNTFIHQTITYEYNHSENYVVKCTHVNYKFCPHTFETCEIIDINNDMYHKTKKKYFEDNIYYGGMSHLGAYSN
jgi:hypothetical protein